MTLAAARRIKGFELCLEEHDTPTKKPEEEEVSPDEGELHWLG